MIPRDAPPTTPLTVARAVIETLSAHGCVLGVSESVSGGTIASYLTRVDGCSKVLFASQVIYSILGKASFCAVPVDKIVEMGTVSDGMIRQMMGSMARRFFDARPWLDPSGTMKAPRYLVSLATSGVAGDPIEGLPRGTVLIGIALYKADGDRIDEDVRRYRFEGNRWGITLSTTGAALSLVLEKAAFLSRA